MPLVTRWLNLEDIVLSEINPSKKQERRFGEVWRKRNTCVLLVGIYTGIVIMENSMVVPQKTTNRTAGDPAILM